MHQLLQGPSSVSANLTIMPPYSSLPYAELLARLSQSSNASQDPTLQLGSLTTLSAAGLAGNSVCEVGEIQGLGNSGESIAIDLALHIQRMISEHKVD